MLGKVRLVELGREEVQRALTSSWRPGNPLLCEQQIQELCFALASLRDAVKPFGLGGGQGAGS